jgi:lycopene cyclase domain-containing protein
MTYTTAAVLAVLATVALDLLVLRTRVLAQQAFWIAYAIILGFQLVTNGILTGRHVVTYDPRTITGERFVWAPVEDLLFGFALVVQTLSWWTFWGAAAGPAARRRGHRRPTQAAGRRGR